MKKYFSRLAGSFYDLGVYRYFIKTKTSQAFGYFLVSLLIIGTLVGWFSQRQLLPLFKERAVNSLDYLRQNYPSDLIINWDGKQLTTEPQIYHRLELNLQLLPLFQAPAEPAWPLIYVNSQLDAPQALTLLTQEEATILIDQQAVFALSPEGDLNRYWLEDYLGDNQFVIDQQSLPKWGDLFSTGLDRLLATFSWLIIPIVAIGLTMVRLLSSLFLAALLWLPASLGKAVKNWRETWRFTLVLMVVVEIIHWLARLLYPQSSSIYALAFWLLSVFILLALKPTN